MSTGSNPTPDTPQSRLLRRLFDRAVEAASPANCLARHLPPPPTGRTIVIGAGKAAASMARAVEDVWEGDLSGLVITRHGHAVACDRIQVLEAAHPVVNQEGIEATAALLARLEGLTSRDLVLCLLSGGGSALMAAPAPGVTLEDKQAVVRALLRSGATINEINCVRKHLSAVKGGRLAQRAAPARIVTLAISDVPGDDPSTIASGPTVPDPTTRQQALAILDHHMPAAPESVRRRLAHPACETPGPDEVEPQDYRLVATPADAIRAAEAAARDAGFTPILLGSDLEGDAIDLALEQAALVRRILAGEGPVSAPCVILSGGETTVTVRGSGRGGRNSQFLLALGVALDGAPGVHALAADTDGIDGSEDNAGAVIGPDLLARATAAGVSAEACMANNDSYGFFAAVGGLITTGPTRTNVNDFRAILIDAPAPR